MNFYYADYQQLTNNYENTFIFFGKNRPKKPLVYRGGCINRLKIGQACPQLHHLGWCNNRERKHINQEKSNLNIWFTEY